MEIETIQREKVTILKISGDIVMESGPEFLGDLNDAINQRPGDIALNLADVNFIDSSGVGTLIKGYQRVRNLGSEMYIFGLNDVLKKVFVLTQVNTFLIILSEEEFNKKFPLEES